MNKLRNLPYVTLSLALLLTIIQVSRSFGNFDEVLKSNLIVYSWEILYSQPWRILTSPFLHHNYLHFLENLAFLLLFGWQIEKRFGKGILLGAFFGGLISSYVIWINVAHEWIMGISGGVCGLFGYSLIGNRLSPWGKNLTHRPLHILYTANLLFAVLVDYMDWVPFDVAHLVHVLGILYGIAFGLAFQFTGSKSIWRTIVVAAPVLLFASQVYSPWQPERQLLRTVPILLSDRADCQLRSIPQEEFIPAELVFVNNSPDAKAVYWLDYEGEARFLIWLGAGDSKEFNSFIGHPWCIVDIETNLAHAAVTIEEAEQVITIQE